MKRINITCPACGSRAYLRPASVVYGDKAPDPDAKYYVCGRYPACDCYVAAHRKTMLPMGTLADKALRKKRHDAHVALDSLWKNGIMSRKEAYRLLQLSMGLPAEDAHIAKFSAARCDEVITLSRRFRAAAASRPMRRWTAWDMMICTRKAVSRFAARRFHTERKWGHSPLMPRS